MLKRSRVSAAVASNSFTLEWPPRSGVVKTYPEVDRAAWFGWPEAEVKILVGQRPILERLKARLEAEDQDAA